jgi:parvulin-like peptidyl-prolyl isomerase
MQDITHDTQATDETDKSHTSNQQAATRRSLVLFACGALIGLSFAGYSLFTAKGTRTSAVPKEAMALINGRPILRSDFTTQVQALFSVPFDQTTAAQRRKVLDDMIAEELSVQRGVEIDLPSFDPEVRAAMVAGVELEVTASVLAQQPSREQLRQWYDMHKDQYVTNATFRLRDLVSHSAADAAKAVAAIRSGKPADQIAKDFGLEDSGRLDSGTVFDFAAQAKLEAPVYAAASRLAAGSVSDPVAAADGIHVIVMIEHSASEPQAFETVVERVLTDYKKQAHDQILRSSVDFMRGRADIQMSDEAKALGEKVE